MTEAGNTLTSLAIFDQHVTDLTRQKDQYLGLIKPTTIPGKLRLFVARNVPSLRDVLMQRPMQEMRATTRKSIFDIYDDLTNMRRERGGIIGFHKELMGLIEQVRFDPENDELAGKLRSFTRAKVEIDLTGLRRDPETDRFIDKVLHSQDFPGRSVYNTKVLEEAEVMAAFTRPVKEVIEAVLVGGAHLFDSQKATYALMMELGPAMDLLDHHSRTVLDAAKIHRVTPQLIIGQLSFAVKTAELALQAAQLGGRFDGTTDFLQLREISEQAQQLLQQVIPPELPPSDHD